MKTRNFSILSLVLILLSFQVQAERSTKRIYKSFPVKEVGKLELSNKYGNIRIDDNRKDSVVISVEIWVEGTGSRAKKLLDDIDVAINSSGNTVNATTEIENNFTNYSQEFSIDYQVSVPADKELSVSQKYGSVNMNNLTGKGLLDIKYGDLKAKNLLSPSLKLDIAYSKATVESTKDLDLSIRYSKINLQKCENLKVDSRYSGLVFGDCRDVIIDSKYDDYKFASVQNVNCSTMYTGYRIEQLASALMLTNSYGDFSVSNIPATFKSIKVSSRYATVRLGIASGASFKLDGTARYCDIKHPAGKLNTDKDGSNYEVHGTIGDSENPKSTVQVDSSYGNVVLRPW